VKTPSWVWWLLIVLLVLIVLASVGGVVWLAHLFGVACRGQDYCD
jgi:hypothetical protein